MPSPILGPAVVFLLVGAGAAFVGFQYDSLSTLLWVGVAAMISGAGLLLRQRWARYIASVLIFAGYLACAFAFVSLSLPMWEVETDGNVFPYYLGVLAVVAALTFLSGNLSSRAATSFLNSTTATRK